MSRVCSECGKEMSEGFYVDDEGTDKYYCSEECLNKNYTPSEYTDLWNFDMAYWTTFEEDDDE